MFPPIPIPPDDPLTHYLLLASGVVDLDQVQLASPALQLLRAAGVKLTIPLIHQGELLGALHLGPRMSQQDYSPDDRELLKGLATQVAPALRVAQLVRAQRAQARERERIEQELRVARLIQQTLLPKDLPALPNWQVAAHYQPARMVGGDFYDFLPFANGKLGIVIGDVTDKGVPAALVMATTRSMLRAAAQDVASPGKVLEQTNTFLCPDIPPRMFVTCFYAILDPLSGRLRYANAGHDLPYRRSASGVDELRATGMPLGLMPGMRYDEKELIIAPGDCVLFYSDGLVEAHNPQGDMFGFPRLGSDLGLFTGDGQALVPFLLDQLAHFTGPGWEQEDDVTLVTLHHLGTPHTDDEWQVRATWEVPAAPGNERLAMQHIDEFARAWPLSAKRREQLATAVAEATMNAMEHGNGYGAAPVTLQALTSSRALAVRISDEGAGGTALPGVAVPDLDAKLTGAQSPRGWGLFLIQQMVDRLRVLEGTERHTVELLMYFDEGATDVGSQV